MTAAPRPRWFSHGQTGHSQWYIQRFRAMAAEGIDLAGEARLVDAMAARGSRILDAGCGPGRVGAELNRRGHTVVGVDVDPELVAAAAEDYPGPRWVVADLSELALDEEPFDLVVMAGNVMVFLAPGTERRVLERLRGHTRPGGRIVIGFRKGEAYTVEELDRDAAAAGLEVELRFSTWDLEPWQPDSGFAVTVLRVPDVPKTN